ncbi:TPA: phage protein Gp13 family protein [Kluyvera georgiana]
MEIVKATLEHLLDIEETISLDDLKEFIMFKRYIYKDSTITLLKQLIDVSDSYPVHAMVHKGKTIAIGGEVGGCVWFITSCLLMTLSREDKREFINTMISHKNSVLEKEPFIYNYVWEENASHIKFLKLMGAVFPDKTEDVPEHFKLFIIQRG